MAKKTIERQTHTIDAEGKTLGRLAGQIADLLRGKSKPTYLPNVDGGDHVKVINASKIKLSGKKIDQKIYFRHTGYLGNQKEFTAKMMMSKDPTQVIWKAVYGMIPANKLRKPQMKRLKITA